MADTTTGQQNPSTRDRLLEAARELFYEQGYNATTLAQISERSGVNNGLITYYFGTKNNLASEIYNLYLMNVRAEISMQLFTQKKEFNMELGIAVENRILLGQKFDNPNLLRFYNEYHRDRTFFVEPNDRRERYYTLQKELINPNISDIDLKLYEVCGIAVARSVTDAYEKGFLNCDITYLKDYVVQSLLNMLQIPPYKVAALVGESRYWEETLNIRIGEYFQPITSKSPEL